LGGTYEDDCRMSVASAKRALTAPASAAPATREGQ
jgi:hypothetical protein